MHATSQRVVLNEMYEEAHWTADNPDDCLQDYGVEIDDANTERADFD